ncbi:MAG: energy-coupling factor ABC transporter permease [Desulfurococcaceae archaeon]
MHIPDGVLSINVILSTYVALMGVTYVAFSRISKIWSSSLAGKTSSIAALTFAAQMINWPIPGGTSLHFVGGALSGIVLGPWAGFTAMLIVLLVQALIFHDGGLTALGANAINMAVVAVFSGYVLYKLLGRRSTWIAGFTSGWLSVFLAGALCGVELWLSNPISITPLVVMALWHAALGVIEGAITASAIAYVKKKAPQIIEV